MSIFDKLFGTHKKRETAENTAVAKPVAPVKTNQLEYDFITPGLSQYVTFGRNRDGEVAAVVLNKPTEDYHKVIVNNKGRFENFPGIIQGKWTSYIEGKFDFDSGNICFRTSFERWEDGYRCLWEIQPDGRYWADEDGYGAENDSEIILYADLDGNGMFLSPFRIYKIDGRRIEESDALAQPEEKSEAKTVSPDSAHEQNVKLAEKVANHIADELEKPIEKYGKKGVRFPYSRENQKSAPTNYAQLVVSRNSGDDVSLQIGMCREGTDRLYSNFLFEAGKTQDEIKAWLKNTDVCIPVILNCAKELSYSVDEYWD